MLEHTELLGLDTPCFVIDKDELVRNLADFRKALSDEWSRNSALAYSVKTNPLPYILEITKKSGCFAEVVSDEEFSLALSQGFSPGEIVFNGPIKGKDWFKFALDSGAMVNIDSRRELAWTLGYAASAACPVNVGIRANIELEKYCPGETLSDDHHGRFGFSYESGDLGFAIAELRRSPNVFVSGLHMHVTTRSRSKHVYEVLSYYAKLIIAENNLSLRYLDMGGGFYGGGSLNAGAYEMYVSTIRKALGDACDPETVKLIVERGGAVVCTPGYYVGRVVDAKNILDERYVVTDLSRINIDHEMKKTSYNLITYAASKETLPSQNLCGYTCMDSDRLCELKDSPELHEGDIVVINNAGAYSMSFTPEMFIRYPPAVYAKEGAAMKLIRKSRWIKPPMVKN